MRERPLVTDIDRIAAARIAADHLRDVITVPSGRWVHYIDSTGGLHSELDARSLSERVPPPALAPHGDSRTPAPPRPSRTAAGSPRRTVAARVPATVTPKPAASPHGS